MDYLIIIGSIAGTIFTLIAAVWSFISIRTWLKRPEFEITFFLNRGTKTHIGIGANTVAVKFENKKPRPATNVRAYVMFPRSFEPRLIAEWIEVRRTSPGGKFDQQYLICNSRPVVLFQEEALTLEAQFDVEEEITEEKSFHAMIVCAEGTSKTEEFQIEPPS